MVGIQRDIQTSTSLIVSAMNIYSRCHYCLRSPLHKPPSGPFSPSSRRDLYDLSGGTTTCYSYRILRRSLM